jgi:argininosuccinate lyase
MPQKRNPVALEHARAIGSKAVGQANAVLVSVHNTPFGDIVDTEDDLQPLVTSMFKDATRAVRLVAAAMKDAAFNTAKMAERADQGWITVTELADHLSREKGLPFRTGHTIAARFVGASTKRPGETALRVLQDVSNEVLGAPVEMSAQELARVLSPKHFIEVRTTHGGPAPSVTGRAIDASRAALASDQQWLAERLAALAEADVKRAAALAGL